MSFLEQRRRSFATIARSSHWLDKLPQFLPPARHWAFTWSALHLLSFSYGGWLSGAWPGSLLIASVQTRFFMVLASSMLPAFLVLGRRTIISFLIWLTVIVLGVLAGFSESTLRNSRKAAYALDPMTAAIKVTHQVKALVRTTSWSSIKSDGRWRSASIFVNLNEGATITPGEGVIIAGKENPPLPGEIRPVALRITVPDGRDLPGMFDYRLFLEGRGLQWRGKILDEMVVPGHGVLAMVYERFLNPIRTGIIGKLKKILPPLESSMAAAVLLGAKDESSRAASNPFADLGLAHLFAVSGLHVGVLLGLLLLPLQLLGISPWQKWGFMFLVLPPYALLTGLPGSVIRASGLAILATSSAPFGRSGKPLHFLGLLFWATTIWHPDQVLDTGVRLSYTAAAGIIAFSLLTKNIEFPRRGLGGLILGGVFISIAAQWSTLPLAASSFGRISLLSPLANLIAVPAFGLGVWLVVLALAGSCLHVGAGESLGALAWLVFRSLAGIVKFAEIQTGGWNAGMPVPGPTILFVWILLSGSALFTLKMMSEGKVRRMTGLFSIILMGFLLLALFTTELKNPFHQQGPDVWQFDVGQGDCSVLRFPDGWTVMIDTAGRFGFSGKNKNGPLSRTVYPWLERTNKTKFDAIVLTHGHMDHTGGVSHLITQPEDTTWLISGNSQKIFPTDHSDLSIKRSVRGEILHQWRDWQLKVLFPLSSMPGNLHENDHSMVLALIHQDRTQFIWSGDLEKAGESLILSNTNLENFTRIWKAGHHGSNTSGSQQFLEYIKPELILISCGVGNGYHHPNHGYYIVSGDTIPVVRTDLEGSIHLKFKENGEITWESSLRKGLLPASP